MISTGTGRRHRLTAVVAALLLSLTACAGTGADAPPEAAPSPATTQSPAPAPSESAEQPADDTAPAAAPAMEASTPISVSIPAIDREAPLIRTGMRDDGTLEVPPDADGSPASWYDGSPTPGEVGAAVLLGHVNSLTDDSGVFYDLVSLEVGDEVSVAREDGTTATFEIYRVESFAKSEFPTRDVYYPVPDPELRLITCDDLGEADGEFPNNLIVFARLVATA